MVAKLNRNLLRAEAKRIYKEKTKGVPKRKRIPFDQFFKQFRELRTKAVAKSNEVVEPTITEPEDFNFDDFVSVNIIDDAELDSDEPDETKGD